MSYINDALRKAQAEKDSRYGHYGENVFASAPGRFDGGRKWVLVLTLIAVVAAAAGLVLYTSNGSKPAPVAKSTASTAPAASVPSPALPIIADLYRAALEFQETGRPAEAERTYRQVLERDPSHSGALNNLGVLYMNQKKTADAVQMFKQAAALRVNADPYYNLSCIHARMNELSLSLQYLKTAVAMNPQVKSWAKEDKDLKNLQTLSEFKKIIE